MVSINMGRKIADNRTVTLFFRIFDNIMCSASVGLSLHPSFVNRDVIVGR